MRLGGWPRAGLVRTPTVLATEPAECGAAALAMVLAHHGRHVPLAELRLRCGVTRDGSKASNLVQAAQGYGLRAQGYRKQPPQLRALPLPFIVFWNFNHYLVVEGFERGRVHLNDPASGHRTVSDAEFDRSYTGVVLCLDKGPDFAPGGQAPSLRAALRSRLQGVGPALGFVVLIGLALVIPGLAIPAFASNFVDKVLVAQMQSWLRPLLLGMLATGLLRALLSWLEAAVLMRIQLKIGLTASARFFWHVLHLPAAFFTQRSGGELGTRVAINDRVAALLSGELAKAILDGIKALVFVLLMAAYDGVLTLMTVALVAANLWLTQRLARRMRETSTTLAQAEGKLMAVTLNGLDQIESIKANGSESAFFAQWAGHHARYLQAAQRLARQALPTQVLPPLLVGLNTLLVLGYGGLRVIDGQLSIGLLVAFQSLVMSFTTPAGRLVALVARLQQAQGDMARLDDVMRHPTDPAATTPLAPPAGPAAPPRLQGQVELRGVCFGHHAQQPPLIDGFSLLARPGQRVAIVGPSGCGKTTLARLIMGLHQPWSGTILFDGQPHAAHSRYGFTSAVGHVDQTIDLFEGTVRDNLTLWDPGLPEADMVQAARDAQIHEAILARPGGYDSRVDAGGRNFSGGQRQRLELARALATQPRVLVLDEATSALDTQAEQAVDEALRRRGCTCILFAHRLSTVRDCDEIIVMDGGRIVERGRHEDLMALPGGHYQALMQHSAVQAA